MNTSDRSFSLIFIFFNIATFYIQTRILFFLIPGQSLKERSKLIIPPLLVFPFPTGVSVTCFLEHNDGSSASHPLRNGGGRIVDSRWKKGPERRQRDNKEKRRKKDNTRKRGEKRAFRMIKKLKQGRGGTRIGQTNKD